MSYNDLLGLERTSRGWCAACAFSSSASRYQRSATWARIRALQVGTARPQAVCRQTPPSPPHACVIASTAGWIALHVRRRLVSDQLLDDFIESSNHGVLHVPLSCPEKFQDTTQEVWTKLSVEEATIIPKGCNSTIEFSGDYITIN